MREKTVVALYDHFADARAAVSSIVQAGASVDRVSLMANDSNGDHPSLTVNPAYAREQFDEDSQKQSLFITLGEVGIGLGVIIGFLGYISPIKIPGISQLAENGAWVPVVTLAVIGGVLGVIIGLAVGRDLSSKDAELYTEGLKNGGTLVTVAVDEGIAGKVAEAFKKHGPTRVEERPVDWSAEGWVSLDVDHTGKPLRGGFATA
jgi:hypothetical protein